MIKHSFSRRQINFKGITTNLQRCSKKLDASVLLHLIKHTLEIHQNKVPHVRQFQRQFLACKPYRL